uniref:Potassium channel domain-containing protein n=1 Tax=Araucaria cunninghamii TaxID=56994 RepID=A0A0D6QTN5_ARACU
MEQPLLNSSNPKRRRTFERLLIRRDGSLSERIRPPPSPAAIVKDKIVYGAASELGSPSVTIAEAETEAALFPRSGSLGSIEPSKKGKFRSLSLRRPPQEEIHWQGTGVCIGAEKRSSDVENKNRCSSHVVDLAEDDRGSSNRKRKIPRSHSAPSIFVGNTTFRTEAAKKPQFGSASSIVQQAFIGVVVYLSVGVSIYICMRDEFMGKVTYSVVDGLYFCIVTLCTIGYGDIVPCSTLTKMLTCAFILVGFGFIDILLSGLVTFVLDKQETVLMSSVDRSSRYDLAKTYIVDVEKGRMRIRMKVALALSVVVLCIGIGTLVLHKLEEFTWVDSFYMAVTSVTTVGYGDYAFASWQGRVFAVVWLLISTLAVARAFLYLAELRIDKRNRLIAKWIMHREMTIGDLLAADLDNNGVVSKSEYVIYKLKELGKVEEKDILEIVKQFNRLDPDNSGKITLSLLSAGH